VGRRRARSRDGDEEKRRGEGSHGSLSHSMVRSRVEVDERRAARTCRSRAPRELLAARQYVHVVEEKGRPLARILRAEYAAKGVAEELDRTLPLRADEHVILEGAGRRRRGLWQRLTYLRLSSDRLCLVEHFALRPDQAMDIPRESVRSLSKVPGGALLEVATPEGAESLTLTGWSGRGLVRSPLYLSPDEMFEKLDGWRG
jgi:hypothetical protein